MVQLHLDGCIVSLQRSKCDKKNFGGSFKWYTRMFKGHYCSRDTRMLKIHWGQITRLQHQKSHPFHEKTFDKPGKIHKQDTWRYHMFVGQFARDIMYFDGICLGVVNFLLVKMDFIVFWKRRRPNLASFKNFYWTMLTETWSNALELIFSFNNQPITTKWE